MASKGPRSKLDHDTRARRQKALEVPKEPPRPKTHWDHVLEEMVWLSKDFETERKWKLSQAKRVAIRASKNVADQATKGEKKLKEEEQRLRKIAQNISKDVKKFWTKIEKLVLYKDQLKLEEKKKKALDKQLDFLLGQTERYSTMLAENLVDMPSQLRLDCGNSVEKQEDSFMREVAKCSSASPQDNNNVELDDELSNERDEELNSQMDDGSEDDEQTIEEAENQFSKTEQMDELAALQAEADLPIEEILRTYEEIEVSREGSPKSIRMSAVAANEYDIMDSMNKANGCNHSVENTVNNIDNSSDHHHSFEFIKQLHKSKANSVYREELEDNDYIMSDEEGKDDEATLSEEENMARTENADSLNEINLLQKESELPLEELLARYRKDCSDEDISEYDSPTSSSHEKDDSGVPQDGRYNHFDVRMNGSATPQEKASCSTASNHEPQLDESNHCLGLKRPELVENEESVAGIAVDRGEAENLISDAAAAARLAQPTGNTFLTTKVRTKFPFLLKHSLREYQHIGLDWLVTMYEKRLNGILADEMGLGKTIMTISLLAHLACEKGIWGPHLIVVPTSVMLNWETEFLKWCPAFKILTYYGSAKERKQKRQGWMKPNYFHVCITTYRLVIQDSKVFKRKKWKYLILDEAHLIKNWKSQRWQTLLNFHSKRRILLTGTPLQNDLMELWSLMHFLMPHVFTSHQEFKDWFCNPISGMVEGQEKVNKDVIDRLHNVLRPFILRRLKRDVEKQLPQKHEHVVYCNLSRRQRNLYEDFIASSETQATLANANYFGMISVIMQLRKVCNHPDLFEGRPIISSFDMAGIGMQLCSSVCTIMEDGPFSRVDLIGMNLIFTQHEFDMNSWEVDEITAVSLPSVNYNMVDAQTVFLDKSLQKRKLSLTNIFEDIQKALLEERVREHESCASRIAWWNKLRYQKRAVYGVDMRELVTIKLPVSHIAVKKGDPSCYLEYSSRLADIILSPVERFHKMLDVVESFMFAIPPSRAPTPICWCTKGGSSVLVGPAYEEKCMEVVSPLFSPIRQAIVRRQVYFPDRRLIQFDCGKLQQLALLLRRLKSEGHRSLIFTQMTKMLDILEEFINLYGYTYLRLDGSTPPEERQTLMQRFNTNPKFFLFILSTRSGGVGINLVGADTVIFYDSDWNPAMDQQAQDRCHRIGQTREVHIYRLICVSTIEENILKKANQKRALDDLVIQSGSYNTEFFKKLDPMELFSGHRSLHIEDIHEGGSSSGHCSNQVGVPLSNADVEAAIRQAEDEADYMALKKVEQEEAVDNQEFNEVGKADDDDPGNADDLKNDELISEGRTGLFSTGTNNDVPAFSLSVSNGEPTVPLAGVDDDIDMIADVKQMVAAAAAAGQASSSFENQLRPIDRYAMRFLDCWDPVINKSAIEYQADIEEKEWELDRIEKLKEELEAEIDEDQEPLLYESWDADYATVAYRQHLEALAQRQMEELEQEAQQLNDVESQHHSRSERKCKPKKKQKKTKVTFLRKVPSTLELEVVNEEQSFDDIASDELSIDSRSPSPELMFAESPIDSVRSKRKMSVAALEEMNCPNHRFKKLQRTPNFNPTSPLVSPKKSADCKAPIWADEMREAYPWVSGKIKAKGRVSITSAEKQFLIVKPPERIKKKWNTWNKDSFHDSWAPDEDVILSAAVHEYGTNWSLISDIMYSITGGGFYRGRVRNPATCCERYRELCFKYVISPMDNSNVDKISTGSCKSLVKVSEDQVRTLLTVTSQLPDNELLLQKHFMAVISSVWRSKCRTEPRRSTFNQYTIGNRPQIQHGGKIREVLTYYRPSYMLVMMALFDIRSELMQEPKSSSAPEVQFDPVELEITIPSEQDDSNSDDGFPLLVRVSLYEQDAYHHGSSSMGHCLLAESCSKAETRFRMASEAYLEHEGLYCSSSNSSAFDGIRQKSGTKSLGKHKSTSESVRSQKSKIRRMGEAHEGFAGSSRRPPFPASLEVARGPIEVDLYQIEADASFPSPLDWGLHDMEYTPHEYDGSFLCGLEEIDTLADITDIG